jgi:hypothetical protein
MKKILIMAVFAGLAATTPASAQTTGATIYPTTPPINSPSANISRAGESFGPGIGIRRPNSPGRSVGRSMRAPRNSMRSRNIGSNNRMLGNQR